MTAFLITIAPLFILAAGFAFGWIARATLYPESHHDNAQRPTRHP
jgi:hypothetical protein